VKFAPDINGNPSTSTQLWRVPSIHASPCGFAFSKAGDLYVGFQSNNGIRKIDPATGAVGADILGPISAPGGAITALANDPISGDMYYEILGTQVYRITGTGIGETPSWYAYVTGNGCGIDGLYFDASGTLFYAACSTIFVAPYMSAPATTTPTVLASVSSVDGTATASDGSFVLGNRNDGLVTLVTTGSTPTSYDVFYGGSRGDLAAVGPDGCFYFTQTDSIVKLTTLAGGRCNLAPTSTGGGPCGSGCTSQAFCKTAPQASVSGAGKCASLIPTAAACM